MADEAPDRDDPMARAIEKYAIDPDDPMASVFARLKRILASDTVESSGLRARVERLRSDGSCNRFPVAPLHGFVEGLPPLAHFQKACAGSSSEGASLAAQSVVLGQASVDVTLAKEAGAPPLGAPLDTRLSAQESAAATDNDGITGRARELLQRRSVGQALGTAPGSSRTRCPSYVVVGSTGNQGRR